MIRKRRLKIFLAVLFWVLTAITAVAVFMFSSDSGEESARVSQGLLAWLAEHITAAIPHNVLRKIAHFSEFAALGFFLVGGVRFTFGKSNPLFSLIPCALYAVSDEIHQYFVPERACRIFDVFIDVCGSAAGIGVFLLIVALAKRVAKK